MTHILIAIYKYNSGARIDRSDSVCIKCLTYGLGCIIESFMITPAKQKALVASGTLNPHPEAVRSELFHTDFFDPYDFAQVKYEMLRAHSVDEDAVAEVCRQFGLSRESFYQIQQAFQELGFSSFLPRKRGRKGPVKLKGEVLEFALAQKKGESRDRPGALGGFDPGALWHRDSSDDRAAGTEKKTALAEERAGETHSSPATTPCRRFMKMCVARHSRTRSQLPGPWSAFADMEWPACSPAGNRIFPSFFAHRVFLVRPGAGRETFIARNFLRFMNSLPGR